MSTIVERIEICKQLRQRTANHMAKIFAERTGEISEAKFSDRIIQSLASDPAVWPTGWYDPPPGGTAMLFSNDRDFSRLRFDTLRKEQFWPRADHKLGPQACANIYYSPVHRQTGIVGDFGMTIYLGTDSRVSKHLANCLSTLRQAMHYIEVDMEFREIHEHAQKLFAAAGLTNKTTVTWTDKTGTNLGHTIPWTYEDPTEAEAAIIAGTDFNRLRDLISGKRIHINGVEKFTVPNIIAFSFEARLESLADPSLPNVFYHLIGTFIDGQKQALENFEPVFKALGQEPP